MSLAERLVPGLGADEARVLDSALPAPRRIWPAIAWGILWGLSVVLLLATSAYLITRASLIIHILWLGWAIVAVRAFALGRAVFRYLRQLMGHDASFRQLAELRVDLLDRLIPLAPAGLRTTRRGDLLARLVDDVDELQFYPLRVVEPLVSSLAVAVLAVIGVGLVSWPAALTLLACLVAALLVATGAQLRIAGRADRAVAPLRSALSDRIHDTVTNLATLRAYGALDAQLAKVRDADAQLRRALVRRSVGEGVVTGTVTVFAGLATAGALFWGIDPTVRGELAPELLTLTALVPLALFEVFAQVPQAIAAWRRVRVSAQRVASAAPADVPAELPQEFEGGAELADGPLDLELRGASVLWPGASGPVLDGLDLRIPADSRLLVTGESGAGKTTFANALVRFLDYRGSYTIGGVEARELSPDAVRRAIGLIEQRAHLFDESIRQNLLFANTEATDTQLTAALERVGLGAWVRERGGLDAPVGERGTLVSGGQAQRIALARALLADFRVLILDEPTANVDPGRADALVADLLGAAAADRTVILISHTPVDPALVTATLRL
ncbi:thiol reductant ABC exporter subunit CydC [Gulosibacter sediminis]|uniref:thiol reductant ABC exporter subunit CydC n=1 Tax=Gulosibacter sediminis TaxID=1729695 RepID=UPI0024ACAFA2|nr:thiol reductant ABC exporter subunit CydC [Gulosibacter sediminis]